MAWNSGKASSIAPIEYSLNGIDPTKATPVAILGRDSNPGGGENTFWSGSIAALAQDIYEPVYGAVQLDVKSTSANDADAGSGATRVTLEGIDGSGAAVSEVITMNGITKVTSTNSFACLNNCYVSGTGTVGATNAGRIDVFETTKSVVHGVILTGYGRGYSAIYMPPAGSTLYITDINYQIYNNAVDLSKGEIYVWRTSQVTGGTTKEVIRVFSYRGNDGQWNLKVPIQVDEEEVVFFNHNNADAPAAATIQAYGFLVSG